jgi:hypothetical protein
MPSEIHNTFSKTKVNERRKAKVNKRRRAKVNKRAGANTEPGTRKFSRPDPFWRDASFRSFKHALKGLLHVNTIKRALGDDDTPLYSPSRMPAKKNVRKKAKVNERRPAQRNKI